MQKNQQIKTDEYKALRDEMLQSKKYIFERTLIIISVSSLTLFFDKFENNYVGMLLFFFFNIILFFNLTFIVNRIGNVARIAAYIELVLEQAQIK